MATILNYRRFVSKKNNKTYCIVSILRPSYTSEVEHGLIGKDVCEEIFLPDKLVDFLQPDCIGKKVDLQYSVQNGKAVLEDMLFI